MTQAYNLSQLANNLNSTGQLDATDGLVNAVPVANGGTGASDTSSARTNLGLGTMATQAANNVAITGGSITGITDLTVSDGGTGASSFTAGTVLLGNGTSSFSTVSPGTSGNVLTSNGSTWVSGAATQTIPAMQVFTSTGTFTVPAGITRVKVYVTGGGGGGVSWSGGGGGGTAIKVISGLTPGTSIAVTVGAGGAGQAGAGQAGGTSSFGAYCSATGGDGAVDNNYPGNGGIGSGGDLNLTGGGGTSSGTVSGLGNNYGGGGSSFWGGGAPSANGASSTYRNAGNYGGGGSGFQGPGSAGVVVIEY